MTDSESADAGRFGVIYFATHALLPALDPRRPGSIRETTLVQTPEDPSGRALPKTKTSISLGSRPQSCAIVHQHGWIFLKSSIGPSA